MAAAPAPPRFTRADEEAGAREAFEDAALYDFEYRRRRADVLFYRRLARNRLELGGAGPVLDLACGTGRLTLPLLRDGHAVVGVDLSAAMLARAAARVRRLSPSRRARALLCRADLRALRFRPRFMLAVAAFHSLQHLVSDADLLRCLRAVRGALAPGGWLAFDLLPPDPAWIARDPGRRWGRTVFRHPTTGERLIYTTNHRLDRRRRALHMRLYYQPVDAAGRPSEPERVRRLCHRQLRPVEVRRLLGRAGFRIIGAFAGFDGTEMHDPDGDGLPADEHVYVAVKR